MCPFIVDPSSRALNWLKRHLHNQRVEIVNPQSANFSTTLELSVRFGKYLIIEEVDEIEPTLFPLLSGYASSQGSRTTLTLGDKTVDFHPDFRMILCTRQTLYSAGVVRPTNASALVIVINFVTTRAGLVGQLLEASLQHERPELEQKRQELIRTEETMKLDLAKLEDDLLEQLANAHGNILENKELLESLNKTKQSSTSVEESLVEFTKLQTELNKERNMFYPLSEAGSRVYFVLTDLIKINWMYQFSLNSFLHLFHKALEAPCDPTFSAAERMQFLQKRLEALVYAHVLQALFKSDRLMFSLHMVRCLRPEAIQDEEWQHFIGLSVSDRLEQNTIAPQWLSPERVRDVMNLKAALPDLYSKLCLDDARIWTNWMAGTNGANADAVIALPMALDSSSLTAFQSTVLTVQALRPEQLLTAMRQFMLKTLDIPQLSSPTLNLYKLYESETRPTEPILLLISPGADPSQELEEAATIRFSHRTGTGIRSRYRQVAMGQGQADLALNELHTAAESGDWLCLKNLHLVINWLPRLEKEINILLCTERNSPILSPGTTSRKEPSKGVHEDFRLWLTAEPHPAFPTALLQSCLKVAYEAPPGLKRNLRRTYESWSKAYFDQGNSITRTTTLATLAWFHAIVQERRSYIPQGWTKFYEFSYTDLRAAADVIDRLMLHDDNKPVRDVWDWIHGLLGDAIYGGRLDNASDHKVLRSYLNEMFNDQTVRKLKLGSIQLPNSTDLRDYSNMIETLPDYDVPDHFNLPANINRSVQQCAANRILAQLRLLRRTTNKADKFDKAVWNQELSPILSLWKKLNQGLQLIQHRSGASSQYSGTKTSSILTISQDFFVHRNEDPPVVQFIRLELNNALHLVQTVHTGLVGLSRACRGTQFVTSTLYQLAQSLLHGETPSSWLAEWPEGPEEPMAFIRDLVTKASAVQNWMNLAETNQLLHHNSAALNLADLFRPSTFLNAVRQQTARQIGVAIDTLTLVAQWTERSHCADQQLFSSSNVIRVTNLRLDGACFEAGRLTSCKPESPSTMYLPDVALMWLPQKNIKSLRVEDTIGIPVYLDMGRQHLVTYLDVPCPPGTQNQWIQAGTALLLSCL